jgi:hypothetical protein
MECKELRSVSIFQTSTDQRMATHTFSAHAWSLCILSRLVTLALRRRLILYRITTIAIKTIWDEDDVLLVQYRDNSLPVCDFDAMFIVLLLRAGEHVVLHLLQRGRNTSCKVGDGDSSLLTRVAAGGLDVAGGQVSRPELDAERDALGPILVLTM